jgi:hypothetical protein
VYSQTLATGVSSVGGHAARVQCGRAESSRRSDLPSSGAKYRSGVHRAGEAACPFGLWGSRHLQNGTSEHVPRENYSILWHR